MNEAEVVRRRPGMYVGDFRDGSGLHHMVWEVLANAVDEFLAGRCSRIEVTLEADGAITIEDDGRGMRTDLVNGRPFPEIALTTRHDAPTLDGHARMSTSGYAESVSCRCARSRPTSRST